MTNFVLPLEQINNNQADIAGGKGASLGEMIQAGIQVPPGFIVTRSAFDEFMAVADPDGDVGRICQKLARDEIDVTTATSTIREMLAGVAPPQSVADAVLGLFQSLGAERVSVRSSATCEDGADSAWAGQMETYLGVPVQQLVARVRDCWLSIFSESALAYGAAHGYGGGQFAVAVVVQTMIASEVSGIGFSVHPVTQDPDVQLIEAGLGLGEAIVSGQIVPDQYAIETSQARILEQSVAQQTKALYLGKDGISTQWRELGEQDGGQQKLTDDQILEYSSLLDKIQRHYGFPVDTEWAMTNGRFHVLQSRPITTLAAEYELALVDKQYDWKNLVRRPMSLLEVSIVAHWMDTEHAGIDLGIHADHALFIQDDAGMANIYLLEQAMSAGFSHLTDLQRNDRGKLLELLHRAQKIAAEGVEGVNEAAHSIEDLRSAGEYLIRTAEYTTTLPVWLLIAMDLEHIDDPDVRAIAEALRAQTLYPRVERYVVDPLAEKAAQEMGFSEPQRAMEVATWHELCDSSVDVATMEQRLEQVKQGKHFVYQCLAGKESLHLVDETGYLMARIARQNQVPIAEDPNVIRGQAAWPGVHRGRARVVLAADAIGQTIEEGEVLVSIQSSPALMPLLLHAGAIVTDEGGVACHAAIICRELKIPTLIATGRATHVIKTGDLLEVDATAQLVRILERA